MNPKPMKRYYVTEMFTYTYEVEANSEQEAQEAYEDFKQTKDGGEQIIDEVFNRNGVFSGPEINVEEVK